MKYTLQYLKRRSFDSRAKIHSGGGNHLSVVVADDDFNERQTNASCRVSRGMTPLPIPPHSLPFIFSLLIVPM